MNTQTALRISSPAFEEGGTIPERHTCDGGDLSPELEIRELPEGTKSLALVVEDPDAPRGTWTHWLMWDIPPTDRLQEGAVPGTEGENDFGKLHYGGPCPPGGTHRYYFRVYALDTTLGLKEGATKQELMRAMAPHVLASGELMGRYSRK